MSFSDGVILIRLFDESAPYETPWTVLLSPSIFKVIFDSLYDSVNSLATSKLRDLLGFNRASKLSRSVGWSQLTLNLLKTESTALSVTSYSPCSKNAFNLCLLISDPSPIIPKILADEKPGQQRSFAIYCAMNL